MAVRIRSVVPASPAHRAGLRAGMELVSLDGHGIFDGLDYEFYSPPARLAVVARMPGGREKRTVVRKAEYEPLGCEFESYLIDRQHACRNQCVFCFVDQLPPGLRAPLYFKDDDERLGFLFGNYVTLTNLAEREIQRIIEMKISPVNISVHTANPKLRVRMMKNPRAGEVLGYIPRLAAAGIAMNVQLVLCPGWNDGDELRRSVEWLAQHRPAMQSVAAVPVGLTRHRTGLPALSAYTPETAAEQLDILLAYGEEYRAATGRRFVYPSDEWFLLAGRPVPDSSFYDDYPQLENGVGMWRLLHEEFVDALAEEAAARQAAGLPAPRAEADIVAGTLAAPLLEELAALLRGHFPGVQLHVHAVQNDFFGPGVTVTGLLTGKDIAAQLAGRLHTGRLLLPECTLRAEGDRMLDETTPAALAGQLGAKVQVVPEGGARLLAAILGGQAAARPE